MRGGPQQIPRPDRWSSGGPPPWVHSDVDEISVTTIERTLLEYQPSEILRGPAVTRPREPGPESAGLVTVYDGDAGATTILTRRPQHMRKHAGEVSFPGGAADEGDETLWHTALREAHEEIALDPALPRPIGALDRFVTGASFSLVAPLVGALDDRPDLVASPDEVDAILHVPLRELLNPDVYRHEVWEWGG